MSTISRQYSTVPPYSLYQAGQGSSASSQSNGASSTNGAQDNSVSDSASQNGLDQGGAQQSGSLADAQNNLASLQTSLGNNSTAATLPAPTTYSNSGSTNSSSGDSSGSFINNQQANADYQSMVLNLGMGNIAAAAKDYAHLQTDLKLHGQHHSGGTISVDMNSSVDSAAGSVLNVTV